MMTHDQEQASTKTNTKTLSNKPASSVTAPKKTAYSYKKMFLVLLSLVALLSAFCALKANHRLEKKQLYLEGQLEKLQKENQEALELKTSEMSGAQKQLKTRMDQLSQQVQTTLNQKLYQNQDWVLLKARYYLELAQMNVHWSQHYEAAIALLKQADLLIEQLPPTSNTLKLRQAIAKEIAQLTSLPQIDSIGLLSQLDALQEQLGQLNLLPTTNKPSQDLGNKEASSWNKSLQHSLQLLKKMVVIRRDNEPVQALISPLYEGLLKESIRLNLQEAQWAILNQDTQVYQLALKQARAALERSFGGKTQEAQTLIEQLKTLSTAKIHVEQQELNLALPLINQLIAEPSSSNAKKGAQQE